MDTSLSDPEVAVVTLLLQSGKTIKEIAKFAQLDITGITDVARGLDIEPATDAQRRGKALFASADGLSYQEIAKTLAAEGFTAEDDAPMHHLTVAAWVRNHGWAWGGADDGNYAPERGGASQIRSRYVMRLSRDLEAEINSPAAIASAAERAWSELSSDATSIVQVAIVRGAAAAGVTDLVTVRKKLLADHGDEIRTARG